ncbi:thiol:disulfide interchange protein DsbD [Sinobacterium caligoides]|uniref:Thiol:disulfide interchange protein DsbD n=1 Tax=Sinobacterium caligoides TaxID=933926 RepID=A0A3N2DNZ1_9GAMM|nr:protein-disulfide reductase DsbD [Sinobacterium caligoides]ROS01523.1 thiol:disulfide interchange protein DsbD [Sinobacterium caligoides]
MHLARLSLLLLCLISFDTAYASSDPFTSGNTFSNSTASGFSNNTTAEFLTVDQAYQLSPVITAPESLRLEWQMVDHYYLYRHAFKVLLDGRDVTTETMMNEGLNKHDEFFGDVQVYYQNHDILLDNMAPGAHKLSVTYQGCADAGLCYPPKTVHYDIDSNNNTVSAAAPSSKSALPNNGLVLPPQLDSQQPGASSLIVILFFALAGGLILNLMPCVLPVLSLKALSINNQNIHKTRVQSWYYTLGVVCSFVGIAALLVALRAAGEAIGWGFQLQSPWFVAILAYLFLLLGLAMSGYTELGSSLMGAGQSLTQGNTNHSAFFTGVLATVVASPCTAPFMGAATGYALGQPSAVTFLVFAALGLGMALPFLLIGYIPALHNLLPKPGNWMVRFKEFLAFPLYGTALWLLWVVGRQVGIDAAMIILGGGILIAFALWLWRGGRLAKVLGVIAIATAISFLSSHSLKPNSTTSIYQEDGYQPYSDALLTDLLQRDEAVFVNFTADWCITCLANEKTTLHSVATQQLFEQNNIKRLKADWTSYNPEITAALGKHGRSGVPLYLYYPAGSQSPIVLPQILTNSIMSNAIKGSP